jgi:hypothetical protein
MAVGMERLSVYEAQCGGPLGRVPLLGTPKYMLGLPFL